MFPMANEKPACAPGHMQSRAPAEKTPAAAPDAFWRFACLVGMLLLLMV
jgi:hypothetical protein